MPGDDNDDEDELDIVRKNASQKAQRLVPKAMSEDSLDGAVQRVRTKLSVILAACSGINDSHAVTSIRTSSAPNPVDTVSVYRYRICSSIVCQKQMRRVGKEAEACVQCG